MTNKSCITIWHDGMPEVYDGTVGNASERDIKNGIKQHGYHDASAMSVRIFTKSKLSAGIGDFIRPGTHQDDGDRNSDLRITEIHDNRKGAAPHYRLVCGR
ncbi:MAG: hypothetical protein PUE13_05395 [Clostridiales bacterium]|nr:hypothetical protein [Clostridiales bacterium]